MSILTDRERQLIQKVGIEPSKVGPVFANGSQCQVHDLEIEGEVAHVLKLQAALVKGKLSNLVSHWVGGQSLQSARKELELSQKYFDRYLLPTTIHAHEESGAFAVTQPKIEYERITPTLVEINEDIRNQLKILMQAHASLIENEDQWLDCMGCDKGRLLEFFGPNGTPYFDNLVLEKKTQNVKLLEGALYSFSLKHLPLYLIQHENARRFGLSFDGH